MAVFAGCTDGEDSRVVRADAAEERLFVGLLGIDCQEENKFLQFFKKGTDLSSRLGVFLAWHSVRGGCSGSGRIHELCDQVLLRVICVLDFGS